MAVDLASTDGTPLRRGDFLQPFRAVETAGDVLRRTPRRVMRGENCLKDLHARWAPTVVFKRRARSEFKFKRSETTTNG